MDYYQSFTNSCVSLCNGPIKGGCRQPPFYLYSAFHYLHFPNGLLTGWRLAALPWLKQMAFALLGWTNPHGPASPVKQQG